MKASTLDKMSSELRELEEQFEQMVIQIGKDCELPAEVVHFAKTRLGWDDAKIQEERRRIGNVITLQGRALKREERCLLSERLEKAKEVLSAEGPAIEAEIEKLQAKLNSLRAEPTRLENVLSIAGDALGKLEQHIPPYAIREIARIKADSKELIVERNEWETAVKHLRHVVANPTEVDVLLTYEKSPTRLWVDELDGLSEAAPLVNRTEEGRSYRYAISSSATKHLAKAESVLPEWETRLVELDEAVRTTVDEPIRKLRCHYHNH